jgi:replicative DNA helicase
VRTTAETLLVSSILVTGNVNAAREYGVTPEQLRGCRDEYEWVQDYFKKFGEIPTPEKMRVIFPEFPFSPDEDDPRWSAAEVQEAYAKRQLMGAVVRADQLMKEGKVREAYAEFERLRWAEVAEKPRNLLLDPGYLEDYESTDEHRIDLPWPTAQAATGGIGAGELWYYLARQAQGKTAHLADIAVCAAAKGARVLYYALEMTQRQMQVRAHAIMGHILGWGDQIDAFAMLHRDYPRDKYRALLNEIEEAMPGELHIHDLSMGLVKPATVMGRADEYDLVVIDHTGLMRDDQGKRSVEDWRVAASISNGLKEVVGAKKSRILAAVQINREGDNFNWRPPALKYAAQTDAVGQDADVAITMKRYSSRSSGSVPVAVASIEKNRHGESGRLYWTKYLPNTGDYDEISRETADQMKDDADDEE